VGGILGQQVIKVISAKGAISSLSPGVSVSSRAKRVRCVRVCALPAGEPEVHNLFFYDARSALGSVEAITV
jgi:hypothetical protein